MMLVALLDKVASLKTQVAEYKALHICKPDPALVYPALTPPQKEGAVLLREIVQGHDLDWIAQPSDHSVTLQAVLDQWFAGQIEM